MDEPMNQWQQGEIMQWVTSLPSIDSNQRRDIFAGIEFSQACGKDIVDKGPDELGNLFQVNSAIANKLHKAIAQYKSTSTSLRPTDEEMYSEDTEQKYDNSEQKTQPQQVDTVTLRLLMRAIQTEMSLGKRLKLITEWIRSNPNMSCEMHTIDENSEGADDTKSQSELDRVLQELPELASVEGYEEGSYIQLALSDIIKLILNKETSPAFNKVGEILGEILPFDFDEFFTLFEKTKQTAKQLRGKACWVLLGQTGAGKSTSIHYMCGSQFKRGTGGAVIVVNSAKSLKDKDIKVGTHVTESMTRYIDEVKSNLAQYRESGQISFDRTDPDEILWVDSPGFEDTAGAEVNIANGIGTIRALKQADKVKVIVTFKEAHLDSKFAIMRGIANNMGKAFNNLEMELDKRTSAVTGFLTKANHGKKEAQKEINKAYKELVAADGKGSKDNALFKALVYKLGKGKGGNLYEIKIDVDNPQNNEKQRIAIIKSLVEDTAYVTRPNETFNEFISDASLTKLKSQIEKYYETIKNILENDKYFGNRKYIQYIVQILSNIDKLKDIIRNAGGKFVESRLAECMDVFKENWSKKIARGNNILTNIEIKNCSIQKLNKKLNEFNDIKRIMKDNVKVLRPCKYYKQLKGISCLNEGLHTLFDEVYGIIKDYLNDIRNKVQESVSDDSENDVTDIEDSKYNELSDAEANNSPKRPKIMRFVSNDEDDSARFKTTLACIEKCCLLYKQYKNDRYVRKKMREFERLLKKIIKDLKNKLEKFIKSSESKQESGVSTLISMFCSLSKVYNISKIMDEHKRTKQDLGMLNIMDLEESKTTAGMDDDFDDDEFAQIEEIIRPLVARIRENATKTIKTICQSYSMNVMRADSEGSNYIDVDTLVKQRSIKTDNEKQSREKKLVTFCLWIAKICQSLKDTKDLRKISIFTELEQWLNDISQKWTKWVTGACLAELQKCNDLLIGEGAQSWNSVERLILECESLRKVEVIANNTSQEYFKTLSEFDYCRTALAKEAADLLDEFNKNDDTNMNYDKIIKIAHQLYNAGCTTESQEMKKIYQKLKQHLNDLKSKTEQTSLSIEMTDDLIVIKNTMKELDTLQTFATFMPDIKKDASECYLILNNEVLQVLNEVKAKFDISKYSTANSRNLRDKLKDYSNVKKQIDTDVLNNVIMKCALKSLTQLISQNKDTIAKLEKRNKRIEEIVAETGGQIEIDIKKYTKLKKKGKQMKMDDDLDADDIKEWLTAKGFKSFKEIKSGLAELEEKAAKVCTKEKAEKKRNESKIYELNNSNDEVIKCVEAENSLMVLKPVSEVIQLRMNAAFLDQSIEKLDKLLVGGQKYIFATKLGLYEAYYALKFLAECKVIKWNLGSKIEMKSEDDSNVLSSKYVTEINKNTQIYFRAYGDNLEQNLNDLISKLSVRDVASCNLNDSKYRNDINDVIAKLNDCLREFREIANFDNQMKMALEEDYEESENKKKKRQMRLVPKLFTNPDIQMNADKYINTTIGNHKNDVMMNFGQWQHQSTEKLPVLRFICLSMSSLDRFTSLNKNEMDTYYQIASQIDGALTDTNKGKTEAIIPLAKNNNWPKLKHVLDSLQRVAGAHKEGIAQRMYRDAVMTLFAELTNRMNETKTKVQIEINREGIIKPQQILKLNEGLKAVTALVETITPHLHDDFEKNKVKTEEKALGDLLSRSLRRLMNAAVEFAKKKSFRQCDKRLGNLSALMEYNTFYIINTRSDNDDSDGKTGDNPIVTEYNEIQEQIDAELKKVLTEVENANKALRNPNVLNPYNSLRLPKLYDELGKSPNEKFFGLWQEIESEISNTIQGVLGEIQARTNQIGNQSIMKMMTYREQQSYVSKIESSLGLFPQSMKDSINVTLKKTKDEAEGNVDFMKDSFAQFLAAGNWNQVASNLNDFDKSDSKLFQQSRKQVISKIGQIYAAFAANMKTVDGFEENINDLDTYKSITVCFTELKFENYIVNKETVIIIPNIKATVEQMYKDIESYFSKTCKEIKLCLNGMKSSYLYLKNGFYVIIKVLESVDKLPQKYAKRIMKLSEMLLKPMQDLINKLKQRKSKGLDKNIQDIEPLIDALNLLKKLNGVEFHANVRKFIPLLGVDEKESAVLGKLGKDIENIEYDLTVKETTDMLTGFKEAISQKGLDKKTIQTNQAKRVKYLKDLSQKCKALIKSSKVASEHFDMKETEFTSEYITPCTNKMAKDIQSMQKETKAAFSGDRLSIKELQRANANLEAFYSIKNVFEKEINDDKLTKEIGVEETIEECQDTATKKVKTLKKAIQQKQIENMEEYMEQCAESLINLEYLTQTMTYKTEIDDNRSVQEPNDLQKSIETAVKYSMKHITTNEQTKKKINVLYNHLTEVDANYGISFTQQQPAFRASFAISMNDKFHALGIDAIIQKLKDSEKAMKKEKVQMTAMADIDYERISTNFDLIYKKYNALIMKHLRGKEAARTFDELLNKHVPRIANDAKAIARKAVASKSSLLNNFANKMYGAGSAFVKGMSSWFYGSSGQTQKSAAGDPRKCYWTTDMTGAIPELIPYILAVWTLSNASCFFEGTDDATLMKARNAQIVAIICILCMDIPSNQVQLINNLVEVGTGEGKSVIMSITSIVLALLDFDVYCACYSELLSKRDQAAFNDLFIRFGVQNHIQYETFNNVLEQMINDGGNIREITKNIVLAKDLDQKGDDEKKEPSWLAERQKILFIDEVDKFFSTDFFGKQFIPTCVIPSEEMKKLILFVWNEYINNGSNSMHITKTLIDDSQQYKDLLAAFNPEWHDLINESMKDIIDGIRTFKEDSYKVRDGKDIAYKFSDTYSSKVFYGYRTLFTYLFELNQGNITDTDYVHNKLTWFLKAGSFSYSEIPNDFYAILGVTGTLKSLSKKEHEVIQKSYGIRKYIVMPSLFDKSGKLEYAQNRDMAVIKREHFYSSLHANIQSNLGNAIQTIERPIIVFFKDENMLNYFYHSDICKAWRINDRIQLLTPDLSDTEKKLRILNATKPNCITFGTEDYGRGIDFKVYDKKLEAKGMHVQLTYWPDTLAEEIQIKGRTARQGDRGSFHIILNEAAIIDQCEVESKEIEENRKNGTVYEWLNGIRKGVFKKQYEEAEQYVQELKPIHKRSEELAKALREKNVKVAKQILLGFNKGANIQSAAKMSILIDATGSMYACLSQCKTVIQKTLPKLVQFLKDSNIDSDSFEIQVIAYRNYNGGADNVLEFCGFTSDVNELTSFVHSLKADYGWGPEAVEIGLGQLNRQEKKPNIVVLLADAPAQDKAEIISHKKEINGEKYWQTENGGIFANNNHWKEEMATFMSQNPETTFYCFHLNSYAQKNFEEISKDGNGKAMRLNVSKQKESIALLQSALSETILFKMNNGSMEYVEKFRNANKGKNLPTFL